MRGWAIVRVAYTIEQCWHRVPGGTAVAAIEVAREFVGDPSLGVTVVGEAAWHRRDSSIEIPFPVNHRPVPAGVLYEWWRLGWPRLGRGTDLVHVTSPIVPRASVPMVATVHDVAFIHDPTMFTPRGVRLFTAGLERLRSVGAFVLASSVSTLEDLRSIGFDDRHLRVVPLGVRRFVGPRPDLRSLTQRLGIERDYILTVGTIEPRKNLARISDAAAALSTTHDHVVVGPDGWGDVKLRPSSHLVGHVAPAELAVLYSGAAVVCQASIREGFGLPVLEAMSEGAPVVTSRGTSTEEVAAGAAVLVDPLDTDDITRGLREALDRAAELTSAGLARAEVMTWRNSALGTLEAYREALR